MIISPGPLELTTDKLIEQILRADRELPEAEYFHVDIMDGVFVHSKNEIDISQLKSVKTRLNFELHLMVHNPEKEMERWSNVKNVFRVITHQEAMGSIAQRRAIAAKNKWQFGIAVNPPTEYVETDYRTFDFIEDPIDMVMFMTVIPGRQGAPFEPTVLEKIKKFTANPAHPLCACDGHVDPQTAPLLKAAGVEIFNVGSFFTKAPNMKIAYEQLSLLLQK